MILGQTGRPMVCLGGETAHHIRTTGDIVSSYQWINDEPAMVLFPKIAKQGAGAFVICLSSAHLYTDEGHLIESSLRAADLMGMDLTKSTVFRIADVILDGLEDLIRMPPEPPKGMKVPGAPTETDAVASLKLDGETIFEREVALNSGALQ